MLEDNRWLKLLRGGDQHALEYIYRKYKDDLLTVAMSLLCDIHRAEDCLHDVFVRFAAGGGCDVNSNLKGYLMSCILNQARDELKKKSNVSNKSIEDTDCSVISKDTLDELIDCEESVGIFKALAQLPRTQHEAVVLHLYADMKFTEIASLTGVSINTVQSRYRYGVEKLKELL